MKSCLPIPTTTGITTGIAIIIIAAFRLSL